MKEPVLVLLDLRRGGAIPLLRHRPRALELLVLLDLREDGAAKCVPDTWKL